MIDLINHRVAYLKVKGVDLVAKDDIEVTDLVQRVVDSSEGVTVDDLVQRETTSTYGGVTVNELIARDYDEPLEASALYKNIFTVNIKLNRGIPIVRVDNKDGMSIDEAACSYVHEEPIATPDNELFDPDMEDRFTLVATPKSAYTDKIAYIYHDKKYGDLFAIPDLTGICNKDSYEPLIGMELKLEGVNIGVHQKPIVEMDESVVTGNIVGFEDAPAPVSAKTYLKKGIVHNIHFPLSLANLYTDDDKEVGKSNKAVPIQYVSLGDMSAITGGKKVPIYHVFSYNLTSQHYLYNSHYIAPDFIFPLMF